MEVVPAERSDSIADAVSCFDPESVLPDRSCHLTHDFEEIVNDSLKNAGDLRCIYCINFVSIDLDHFKNHLLRVHYTFSYNYMLDEQSVCILPCRRSCITKPRQGNRSHFHCPSCARVYSRKPALSHHIEVYKGRCIAASFHKGRCIAASFNKGKLLGRNSNLRKKPIPCLKSYDGASNSFDCNDQFGSTPKMDSSYTIVVDQDANAGVSKITPMNTGSSGKRKSIVLASSSTPKSEQEEDAASHFGRTVSSRIRTLSKKKQAEAMQKIMQILFEIEYTDQQDETKTQ